MSSRHSGKSAATADKSVDKPTASAGRSALGRFAPLIIIAAVLTVYGTVLSFDLINFDDEMIIRHRFFILSDLSNLPVAFSTDAFLGTYGSFYRPLQTLTFMFEAALSGQDPNMVIFHLTNLLIHIGTCLAIYWLLLTMGYRRKNALIFTLLYAVHPVFVSTIAWIPSRGDELLTLFTILSLIFFIRSFQSNGRAAPYLHGLMFFLAFLSKETAVVIPVLCLAFYILERPKLQVKTGLIRYAYIWPIAGGLWYFLRTHLESASMPDRMLGLEPLLANLRMIPETIGKFLIPVQMRFIPLYNTFDTVVGVIAIILLLVLIYTSKRGFTRRILFGLFWVLLFLAPVMAFRMINTEYWFDYLYHRSYVADIGLVIVLIELLRHSKLANRSPRLIGVVAGIILAYCGVRAFIDLQYYSDPDSFYTEALLRTPNSALCYNNRGAFYGNARNDHEAAIDDFRSALDIFPLYARAYSNLGHSYEQLGQNKAALENYNTALRLQPRDPDIMNHRGNLLFNMSEYEAALRDFDLVLTANKLYPRIWSAKAGCLAMLGRTSEAFTAAEKAIEINPKDEQAYNSRGLARRTTGDLDGALRDFDKAIEVNPEYSRAYNNIGVIYFTRNDYKRALTEFTKAIELDSVFVAAYNNRGSTEQRLNRLDSAMADFNTAIQLNPEFADAYQNRGVILNTLQRFEAALKDFNTCIQYNPSMPEAWFGRGIAKYQLQDYQGSCADWQHALDLGFTRAGTLLAQYCR